MTAPTDWPCGIRVAVVADTVQQARNIIRSHPEFFACRFGFPVTPRSDARGLAFDAIWVVSQIAYERVKPSLSWNLACSEVWRERQLVWMVDRLRGSN